MASGSKAGSLANPSDLCDSIPGATSHAASAVTPMASYKVDGRTDAASAACVSEIPGTPIKTSYKVDGRTDAASAAFVSETLETPINIPGVAEALMMKQEETDGLAVASSVALNQMAFRRPTCMKCGMEVSPDDAYVSCGSGDAKWKCKPCNARCSMLSGICGGWPGVEFKLLSEVEQRQFYASAKATNSKHLLEKFVIETYIRILSSERSKGSVGEF